MFIEYTGWINSKLKFVAQWRKRKNLIRKNKLSTDKKDKNGWIDMPSLNCKIVISNKEIRRETNKRTRNWKIEQLYLWGIFKIDNKVHICIMYD